MKALIGTFVLVAFLLPVLALAQGGFQFDPGNVIKSTTGLPSKDAKLTVIAAVQYVLSFLALIAVVIILWSGFEWMTAGGNEDRLRSAKDRLRNAVVGIVIILLAWAIASFTVNVVSNVTT